MTKKLAITKREAKRICLELWDWCRQTGRNKKEWPEWEHYREKYPNLAFCPYCYYADLVCMRCPIVKRLGFTNCLSSECHFRGWAVVKGNNDTEKMKTEANLFYQQLLKT